MIIVKCRYCQKVFRGVRKTTVFCSRHCQSCYLSHEGISGRKRHGVYKKCVVCKRRYYVPQGRKHSAVYCSRNCLAKDLLSKYTSIYGFKKSDQPLHKYKSINIDGKRVREHRYLMEQKVGRKLTKNEHVHHVNGDSLDNNLDNLEILTNSEHQKIEYKLRNP